MPAKAKAALSGPNKWWQWVLIYPTLAVSVASAAPQWLQNYQAYSLDVRANQVDEVKVQTQLWAKNMDCAAAPYQYFDNPENVKVDATICESGDILVRYSAPENRKGFHWVAIDELLAANTTGKSALAISLVSAAQAAPFTAKTAQSQQNASVICQRFEDERFVTRHVSVGGACFDERIDTFTGSIVDRRQTQCRSSC